MEKYAKRNRVLFSFNNEYTYRVSGFSKKCVKSQRHDAVENFRGRAKTKTRSGEKTGFGVSERMRSRKGRLAVVGITNRIFSVEVKPQIIIVAIRITGDGIIKRFRNNIIPTLTNRR